jgi:hypothetical protein
MVGRLQAATAGQGFHAPWWIVVPAFVILGGLALRHNLEQSRNGKGFVYTLSVPFIVILVVIVCVLSIVRS